MPTESGNKKMAFFAASKQNKQDCTQQSKVFNISFLINCILGLTMLTLNGYPIIIADSWRYAGRDPLHIAGSALPKIVAFPWTKLLDDYGFAFFTTILVGYSLARLIATIVSTILPELRERIGLLIIFILLINFLGLVPLFSISVASEPWSLAAAALLISSFVSGKIRSLDILVLLITSGSHHSNLLIFTTTLLACTVFFMNKRVFKLSFIICSIVFASSLLENVCYLSFAPNADRLKEAFIGGVILNEYPESFERICVLNPELLLCNEKYYSFIKSKRQSVDEMGVFIWQPESLGDYNQTKTSLDPKLRLSISRFNKASREMFIPFLKDHFTHFSENLAIDLVRIKKLLFAHGSIFERNQTDRKLSIGNPKAYFASACFNGYCHNDKIQAVIFGEFLAMLPLCVGLVYAGLKRRLNPKLSRLSMFTVILVIINLCCMGLISIPVARYNVRFLSISSTLLITVLFRSFLLIKQHNTNYGESSMKLKL